MRRFGSCRGYRILAFCIETTDVCVEYTDQNYKACIAQYAYLLDYCCCRVAMRNNKRIPSIGHAIEGMQLFFKRSPSKGKALKGARVGDEIPVCTKGLEDSPPSTRPGVPNSIHDAHINYLVLGERLSVHVGVFPSIGHPTAHPTALLCSLSRIRQCTCKIHQAYRIILILCCGVGWAAVSCEHVSDQGWQYYYSLHDSGTMVCTHHQCKVHGCMVKTQQNPAKTIAYSATTIGILSNNSKNTQNTAGPSNNNSILSNNNRQSAQQRSQQQQL